MTATSFSLMFSGCFVILLFWGCTTVVCLVYENKAMQPTTTTGYYSTKMTGDYFPNVTSTVPSACKNDSDKCLGLCSICDEYFNGISMECLAILLETMCLSHFKSTMALFNSTDRCIWSNVSSLYSNLSHCTEEISDCLLIPWPNPLVEQRFVDIHVEFFQDCPSEEQSDPPPMIVFALVITPICLIPVMVSLVVLKTKNGDGNS